MLNEEIILEALKILKNVCEENEGKCHKCILRNGGNDCGLLVDSYNNPRSDLRYLSLKDDETPRLILD